MNLGHAPDSEGTFSLVVTHTVKNQSTDSTGGAIALIVGWINGPERGQERFI